MPTYTNNTLSKINITNLTEVVQTLSPGETGQSYRDYTTSSLTEIDPNPIYNPVVVQNDTISGTSTTITLNASTTRVEIHNLSYSPVKILRGASTNTPYELLPGQSVREINVKKEFVNNVIVITADSAITSGDVVLSEYRD